MIKIDKGVPIPEFKERRGPNPKFPFRNMEVGDSFFVERIPEKIRQIVSLWNIKLKPKVFAYKKEETGTRVWRVK